MNAAAFSIPICVPRRSVLLAALVVREAVVALCNGRLGGVAARSPRLLPTAVRPVDRNLIDAQLLQRAAVFFVVEVRSQRDDLLSQRSALVNMLLAQLFIVL